MKNLVIILGMCIFILFVQGCQEESVKTNIGGVDLQFMDSQPLIECIDGPGYCLEENSGFNVGLKLINTLPRIVEGASVCISDTTSDSIGGIPNQKPCIGDIIIPPAEILDKKIIPGVKEIYFPASGGSYSYTNINKGNDKTNIYAELMYPLRSQFKINDVCVKLLPNIETDFDCEAKQIFTSNQIDGDKAPVVIEKVEKNIVVIPNSKNQAKLRLNVFLRKSLQGEVFYENLNENKIYFEVTIGNDQTPFYCSNVNSGLVEFKEDVNKEIQCEQVIDLGGENAYNDALNFELRYDYYVLLPTGLIKLTEGIK